MVEYTGIVVPKTREEFTCNDGNDCLSVRDVMFPVFKYFHYCGICSMACSITHVFFHLGDAKLLHAKLTIFQNKIGSFSSAYCNKECMIVFRMFD